MPDGGGVSTVIAEQPSGQPPRSFEEDEDESGWRLRRSQLLSVLPATFQLVGFVKTWIHNVYLIGLLCVELVHGCLQLARMRSGRC
jgi:hypothetical protein